MSVDMSFMGLVMGASLVVKLVMLILIGLSMASWVLIFIKWGVLRKAHAEADAFENRFWSGSSLDKLYQGLSRNDSNRGMSSIFVSGYKELSRNNDEEKEGLISTLDMVARSMRVAASRQAERLEGSLSFLATVGSTSPYIGLFGTVWGIMNSFRALSTAQSTSLNAVAPGIAEALIATAIGLFAAIPAVIAYNRYSDDVERLETRYDNFVEEFTTLVQRQSKTGNRQ